MMRTYGLAFLLLLCLIGCEKNKEPSTKEKTEEKSPAADEVVSQPTIVWYRVNLYTNGSVDRRSHYAFLKKKDCEASAIEKTATRIKQHLEQRRLPPSYTYTCVAGYHIPE